MKFNEMNLSKPILRAVREMGYEDPSPIQEKTIPLVLEGRDILGCAQTGSGKTAAFALPIIQNLTKEKGSKIRALIMTPTRELAVQIFENIVSYSKHLDLRSVVIFGGVSQLPQVEKLNRGVDILIATPGRSLDLVQQKIIDLSQIETFVLDEADCMLDMGFINDVKKVIQYIPTKRQTLLFSATMPKEIEKLASSILVNPETVKQDIVTKTVDTIQQFVYFVDKPNKMQLLVHIMKTENVKNAIVFTRTKHGADKVTKLLVKFGIPALAIHGNKGQNARQDALKKFKRGEVKVLVATDIAARGIDISNLSHVFNYDLPDVAETYIHRIGRTGRAGCDGIAISFCNYDDMENLSNIEMHTQKNLVRLHSEWPMQIMEKTVKQPRKGDSSQAVNRAVIPCQKNAQSQNDTDPKEELATAEIAKKEKIDLSKIKDISLSGHAVDKKSAGRFNKSRFGQGKAASQGKASNGKSGKSGAKKYVSSTVKKKTVVKSKSSEFNI
ncbi:MAG: DEAD/DEAH box helicase [Clostridiales bacterium]|nr:DEAD/DEAH box helicase [Clostridiales bacterium]